MGVTGIAFSGRFVPNKVQTLVCNEGFVGPNGEQALHIHNLFPFDSLQPWEQQVLGVKSSNVTLAYYEIDRFGRFGILDPKVGLRPLNPYQAAVLAKMLAPHRADSLYAPPNINSLPRGVTLQTVPQFISMAKIYSMVSRAAYNSSYSQN